jgi:raffinose/stachyose/melibiose transport system permease protein
MNRRLRQTVLTHSLLTLFSLVAVVPLLFTLLAALHPANSSVSGFSWPSHLSFSAFRTAWTEGQFGLYLRSSAIVAAAVVALMALVSVLAGYAFALLRFPLRNLFFSIIVLGMVIPFEALIVPMYYDFRRFGLTDTYWALILPQTAIYLSFGIYWMRAFFRAAPRELLDAARMDGASSLRILVGILLPLARPAILSMVVLVFIWTWNEFLLPLVMVTQDNLRTAPLGISYFQGRFVSDVPSMAAAGVIVALPAMVVYFAMQRHITRGILSGSIKG